MVSFVRTAAVASTVALATTGLVATPGSAASDSGGDYVKTETVKETFVLKKGEACPKVELRVKLDLEVMTFTKGRHVITTTDGRGTVTNTKTGESFSRRADGVFHDRLYRGGKLIRGKGYGNQVVWGEVSFDRKRDAKLGMYYFDATTGYVIYGALDDPDSVVKFTSVKGKKINICKRLA